MFILKKLGCRIFQIAFRAALPVLPYREPKVLSSCAELGGIFAGEGITSVLVVTDGGIVKNGLTASLEDILKKHNVAYTVYDRTQPNPTVANVEEALKLYLENGCMALVAIGGGSAMDCAKAVGARVAYPKRTIGKMGGILKVLRRLPTLVAIPTTAGTGSETTLAAVITDSETHHKYAIMSFPLIPHYAVLDPTLTYTLPPHMTSTTGMDALTHAVEAYIGRSTTEETRRLANAVTMPYVLSEYGECVHKKLHRLGIAAGVCSESDSDSVGAAKFIEAVKALNQRMGIPYKLNGIDKADIPEMARHAEKEANPLYPVPRLMTAKELERFYYQISDRSEG